MVEHLDFDAVAGELAGLEGSEGFHGDPGEDAGVAAGLQVAPLDF